MSRLRPMLGTFAFLLLAPGIVAGLVPWAISRWEGSAAPPVQVIGFALLIPGLAVLLGSFARFALQGLGTPAPIAPTKHLVVTGGYRYVRNPMYIAVVAIIFGQAAIFGDLAVLAYGAVVWATVAAFVAGYEQPALTRQFGSEYVAYCEAVPGWLPRLSPWEGSESSPRSSE